MHHFILNSFVLSMVFLNVILCIDHNGELNESGRGIIDVQNEGTGSVSYIIHPDNLPDPHFTPLQYLLWQSANLSKERNDKLIDTSLTTNFSNLLEKESKESTRFKDENPSSEILAENHFTPVDPAVSATIKAISLSLIKDDNLSIEVKKPNVKTTLTSQMNESTPVEYGTHQLANSFMLDSDEAPAIVEQTFSPKLNMNLTTFSSVSGEDDNEMQVPQELVTLSDENLPVSGDPVSSHDETLLGSSNSSLTEDENLLTPQKLVASNNNSLNAINNTDTDYLENISFKANTETTPTQKYSISMPTYKNSKVEDTLNDTDEIFAFNDVSTEPVSEDLFELPILYNETEEVLERLSQILLLEEKLNRTHDSEIGSHLEDPEITDNYDSVDSTLEDVTSFDENSSFQISNHTPRYDDASSSSFEDVKNFLTDLASSDGFQSAFLGDLIKNFGNLDHNALKLIYSLLIRPLTERVRNSKDKEKMPANEAISNANYYDSITEAWNPSSLVRPDASRDGLWRPIIRRPKSPVAPHNDYGVEVITAPNSHEFEVILSSSFSPAGKKYLPRHSVAQNRAGFAAFHSPPKNLVLGHNMPPLEALKALPPGAVLIPPSQVIRKPVMPRLPENSSPKMGSGSLSDLLPNFPFFGSKKETPAMERENPSKFSAIPSFFSSLFGKSKSKERPPTLRRIHFDHRPNYPPPPVLKRKYISGKEMIDVSPHSDFNHDDADSLTDEVFELGHDEVTEESHVADMDGSASHTIVHSDSTDHLQSFPNGNINEYYAPNANIRKINNQYSSPNSYYRPSTTKDHHLKLYETPLARDDTLYDSRNEYDDFADTNNDSYSYSYYEDNIQTPQNVQNRAETKQYILPLNYQDNTAGIPHKYPHGGERTSDIESNYESGDGNNYEEYSVDRDDRLSNSFYGNNYDNADSNKASVGAGSHSDDNTMDDHHYQKETSEKIDVWSNEDYYDAPTSNLHDNYDNNDATLDDFNETSDIGTDEKNISSVGQADENSLKESRDKFNDALDLLKKDPEIILYSNIGPVDVPEGTIIPKEDFEKALVERKYKNKFVRFDNTITSITSTQRSPNKKVVPDEVTVVHQGSIDQNTIVDHSYPSLTREHDAAVSHLWNNVKLTLQKEDPENTDLKMLDEKPFIKVPFPSLNYTEFDGMKTNRDERSLMAYILIGSCCGLALLSIVGIVVIVRFKKTCASRQIGGKVRRSHLSGRRNSLGNLSLPDGGDNKSGHKLGSWFTGRNEQFGNSGKLRSNMTLPEVIKAGSTRDLLSLSSASSHTSSLMEPTKDVEHDSKQKRNSTGSDDRIIPVSSSWLHENLEASIKDEQLRKSKSVRSKVKSQNFDSDEAINSPMGAKSYHYYGGSSREFESSKHLGVTSIDSDDLERATTGHSRYHSDSEFDETSYDNADSRDDLGALAKSRSKHVRSMDSEELGEEISRDLRNFQKERSKGANSSNKFNRTSNAASFSRDNIQNEVFLEFDKMLRQHTHPSTIGGGSTTLKSNFSETPPQSPTFNESANSDDVNHNKPPYTPQKFNPPAPPPRPPKPSRFSPDSSAHSPRSGRARAPTPKENDPHLDESSDDERLI